MILGKLMENEIVVRTYNDVIPFLENESKKNLLLVNNTFIDKVNSIEEKFLSTNTINKVVSKVANGVAIANQAKNAKSHLEAILTPEMKKALKEGTAKLYNSHKDGKIFPEIRFEDGRTEFLRLERIADPQAVANITVLSNQMMMQQQLSEIQDTLTYLSEKTNEEFNNLRYELHKEKIDKVETAKADLETYLREGNNYRDQVFSHINEAFPSLKRELIDKLNELNISYKKIMDGLKSKQIKEEMSKQENDIKYILEDLTNLQVLYHIELYLTYTGNYVSEEKKDDNYKIIQNKYSDVFIEIFTEDNLELLSGLYKGSRNIWYEDCLPGIKSLKENKKEYLLCQKNVQENIMVAQ